MLNKYIFKHSMIIEIDGGYRREKAPGNTTEITKYKDKKVKKYTIFS